MHMGTDIDRAAGLLREGLLVAIPTETVYGLAGNALDAHAVAEIFRVKNRPHFDPLIVHGADSDSLFAYAAEVPDDARLLARHFWPGPLTLLLPRTVAIPDLVTAGSPLVALRAPRHPLTQQLLRQLNFPLAAPSANPFGYVSPTTAQHVADQLGSAIPYILDGGPCSVGVESTIVGWPDGVPTVYRLGGVPLEALEEVVGPLQLRTHSTSNPTAPGQLTQHYSPGKTLLLGDIQMLLNQLGPDVPVAILSYSRSYRSPQAWDVVLAPDGRPETAAQNLFAALRSLDRPEVSTILAEPAPNEGLGRAINDRLRRAAAHD